METFFKVPKTTRFVNLPQGTDVWHAWRNGHDLADRGPRITGTAAAVISGDSVRGITPHRLWLEMTGQVETPQPTGFLAKLFERGHRLEPKARELYEEITGNMVRPTCVESLDHPWAGASLDGLTPSGDIIAEFKCPISQRVHNLAKSGKVPSYYRGQVYWQYLVTPSARELHYFSYFDEDEDGQKGALVPVFRDAGYEAWLLGKAQAFRKAVLARTPLAGQDWLLAAHAYRTASGDLEEAQARLDAAISSLKELIPPGQLTEDGGGVRATLYTTSSNLDPLAVLISLGATKEQAAEAVEATRKPGAVDLKAAAKHLELDPAALAEAVDAGKNAATTEPESREKLKIRISLTAPDPSDQSDSPPHEVEQPLDTHAPPPAQTSAEWVW